MSAAGPGFLLRPVALAPGTARPYEEDDWRDALVVVKRGELELECASGATLLLEAGDLLWLAGLPLRALRNSGTEPALLVAVSRR